MRLVRRNRNSMEDVVTRVLHLRLRLQFASLILILRWLWGFFFFFFFVSERKFLCFKYFAPNWRSRKCSRTFGKVREGEKILFRSSKIDEPKIWNNSLSKQGGILSKLSPNWGLGLISLNLPDSLVLSEWGRTSLACSHPQTTDDGWPHTFSSDFCGGKCRWQLDAILFRKSKPIQRKICHHDELKLSRVCFVLGWMPYYGLGELCDIEGPLVAK